MVTTIRPNHRPGKLSSKFGAAFAAFENNNGQSDVPQAFRCANWRKSKPTSTHTKPLKQIDASKQTTTIKAFQATPTRTLGACNETQPQRRNDQENSRPNIRNGDQPTKSPVIAANRFSSIDLPHQSSTSYGFGQRKVRVSSSKLANRASIFESKGDKGKTLVAMKSAGRTAADSTTNTRQRLREANRSLVTIPFVASDKKPSTDSVLSDSTSASNHSSCCDHGEAEVDDTTRTTFKDADDGSECIEYIEIVVSGSSSISSSSSSSDGEDFEEYWEEETLDSTFLENEDESVWEEIADGDLIGECRSVG